MKISCRFKQPEKFKKYKQMPKELDKKLKNAVLVVTRQTSKDAKSFAVVDHSGMRNSIHPFNKGLTGVVSVGVGYGPYVEFGTGSKVQVPTELKDYAMQFKGAGIRQVNLSARPYLYPAFFLNRTKFTKECDRILKKVL